MTHPLQLHPDYVFKPKELNKVEKRKRKIKAKIKAGNKKIEQDFLECAKKISFDRIGVKLCEFMGHEQTYIGSLAQRIRKGEISKRTILRAEGVMKAYDEYAKLNFIEVDEKYIIESKKMFEELARTRKMMSISVKLGYCRSHAANLNYNLKHCKNITRTTKKYIDEIRKELNYG